MVPLQASDYSNVHIFLKTFCYLPFAPILNFIQIPQKPSVPPNNLCQAYFLQALHDNPNSNLSRPPHRIV
jgi:hypothetical protein